MIVGIGDKERGKGDKLRVVAGFVVREIVEGVGGEHVLQSSGGSVGVASRCLLMLDGVE